LNLSSVYGWSDGDSVEFRILFHLSWMLLLDSGQIQTRSVIHVRIACETTTIWVMEAINQQMYRGQDLQTNKIE
jgi:hypothetical protein